MAVVRWAGDCSDPPGRLPARGLTVARQLREHAAPLGEALPGRRRRCPPRPRDRALNVAVAFPVTLCAALAPAERVAGVGVERDC